MRAARYAETTTSPAGLDKLVRCNGQGLPFGCNHGFTFPG